MGARTTALTILLEKRAMITMPGQSTRFLPPYARGVTAGTAALALTALFTLMGGAHAAEFPIPVPTPGQNVVQLVNESPVTILAGAFGPTAVEPREQTWVLPPGGYLSMDIQPLGTYSPQVPPTGIAPSPVPPTVCSAAGRTTRCRSTSPAIATTTPT
jgi:hypothetical protein